MSKPPSKNRGLIFVDEGLCFLGGVKALEAVINIETILDGFKDLLVSITMIFDMFLNCKGGTAWAAGCSKWKNLPFIHTGFLFELHPSPNEAQQGFVLIQKAYLMEHSLYVSADGNGILAESEEYSNE